MVGTFCIFNEAARMRRNWDIMWSLAYLIRGYYLLADITYMAVLYSDSNILSTYIAALIMPVLAN